jgi:hypothetical protein
MRRVCSSGGSFEISIWRISTRTRGRLREAERLNLRGLATLEKVFGSDGGLVARSLNHLALVYLRQGRLYQAEPRQQLCAASVCSFGLTSLGRPNRTPLARAAAMPSRLLVASMRTSPWFEQSPSVARLTDIWPPMQISGERRRDHGSRAYGECDLAQPAIHHEAMSVPMREAAE